MGSGTDIPLASVVLVAAAGSGGDGLGVGGAPKMLVELVGIALTTGREDSATACEGAGDWNLPHIGSEGAHGDGVCGGAAPIDLRGVKRSFSAGCVGVRIALNAF